MQEAVVGGVVLVRLADHTPLSFPAGLADILQLVVMLGATRRANSAAREAE